MTDEEIKALLTDIEADFFPAKVFKAGAWEQS